MKTISTEMPSTNIYHKIKCLLSYENTILSPLINKEVINEVTETLLSGWITTGKKVKKLEDEVSLLTGAPVSLCATLTLLD